MLSPGCRFRSPAWIRKLQKLPPGEGGKDQVMSKYTGWRPQMWLTSPPGQITKKEGKLGLVCYF